MALAIKLQILLVEDNRTDAMLFSAMLEKSFVGGNIFVEHKVTMADAIAALKTENYDLLIVDLNLPDSVGIETIQRIASYAGSSPFVVLSGNQEDDMALLAIRMGAQDYLVKGKVDEHSLRRVIQHSIERRKIYSELVLSREQLRLFIQHTPAALAMLDEHGRYVMATQRWLEVFHSVSSDVTGKPLLYNCANIKNLWMARVQQVLNGKTISGREENLEMLDGRTEQIKWEMVPWQKDKQTIGGVTMFAEVVTQERRLQRELQALNKSLERRVKLRTAELNLLHENKTRFYTNMTHEIRTPLHAIINFSNFGLEKLGKVSEEKIREYFNSTYVSGKRLLWLVNDMLDVAKLQQGQFDMSFADATLAEVVAVAHQLQSSFLEEHEIGFVCELHDDEHVLHMDKDRMIQLVQNLISNSVKFSPKGTTITLSSAYDSEKNCVIVEVCDEGPGIPDDQLESVFDEFAQSDKVKSGAFSSGTGLGLAICKEIIHSHGGTIWAENEEGAGAKISFKIPCTQQ